MSKFNNGLQQYAKQILVDVLSTRHQQDVMLSTHDSRFLSRYLAAVRYSSIYCVGLFFDLTRTFRVAELFSTFCDRYRARTRICQHYIDAGHVYVMAEQRHSTAHIHRTLALRTSNHWGPGDFYSVLGG